MSNQQTSPSPIVPVWAAGAPAAWRALLPSWPWVVGLLAMLRALASPLALLHDPDTYLHITAGRWMLGYWSLPDTDQFSFTMAGRHWVAGEWLGEVALAAAYNLAGWGGVIVLAAACFGIAIGLLTAFLQRRLDPLPAVIAALAGAMVLLPHLLARPHVLVLPLLVWWCGALLAARDDGEGPPWPMLPVMALWANLHGSFAFGLALAVYLGGEAVLAAGSRPARRTEALRWAGFAAATVAVCLVNPNGAAAVAQPFRLVAMPALQAGFGEWRPADFAAFPALALWLAGAAGLLVAARRDLRWTRLVLVLGLAFMAIAHVRHADLLGLVGPLAIAAAVAPSLAAMTDPAGSSPLLRGAALLAGPARLPGALAAALLAVALSVPVLLRPIDRAGDAVTPQAAVAAAQRLGLGDRVFNAEAYGGYLMFAGLPTFIDGRIELYGNDFLAAYLAAERGDAAMLSRLLERYQVEWTLVQKESSMAAALDRLPGWRRVYTDAQAVVHVRD